MNQVEVRQFEPKLCQNVATGSRNLPGSPPPPAPRRGQKKMVEKSVETYKMSKIHFPGLGTLR